MTISPGKLGEVLKSVFIKDVAGPPVPRTAPAVVAERATDGTGMVLWGLLGALAFSFGPWLLLLFLALTRSEEHTSELQSRQYLVCRLLLEKKKKLTHKQNIYYDFI